MKYQNLSKLLAQVQADIDQMGFFEATLKKQSTVKSKSEAHLIMTVKFQGFIIYFWDPPIWYIKNQLHGLTGQN